MTVTIACDAISAKRKIQLSYEGHQRTVEVHAVGATRNGSEVMRVYQVSGGSNSGEQAGWKLMTISKVLSMSLTDEISLAPRPKYSRNDKAMAKIYRQI